VLFAELESLVVVVTVDVSLIAVPAAVPAVTWTVKVIVAGEPAASAGLEQVSVARVQVHPAGPVRDTDVVLAGSVSVRTTPVAPLGPALLTTCVYVIVLPACTGTGLGVFVTETSAVLATGTFTDALLFPLFGSPVDEETESVWVITVPVATFALTFTTKVKLAVVVDAIVVVSVHVNVASTQFQPAGPAKDTAVVFAGCVSVNTGAAAVAGPLLVTLWVYVMLLPAVTGLGLAEFVTLKSACVADATAILTVAELSPEFVSRVVVPPVSMSVMIVPAAVPAATL
jgi:hypothetical protein